jgi:hypothetical protein
MRSHVTLSHMIKFRYDLKKIVRIIYVINSVTNMSQVVSHVTDIYVLRKAEILPQVLCF